MLTSNIRAAVRAACAQWTPSAPGEKVRGMSGRLGIAMAWHASRHLLLR